MRMHNSTGGEIYLNMIGFMIMAIPIVHYLVIGWICIMAGSKLPMPLVIAEVWLDFVMMPVPILAMMLLILG